MKYIKIYLLTVLLLFSSILLSFSQTTSFNIYRYNEQNKLKAELTKAVAQDSLGVYYLATDDGLFALINGNFKKIKIPKGKSSLFKNIKLLNNGDLVALSDDAMYKVNSALKNEGIQLLIDGEKMGMEYAKSIFQDKYKRIWITTNKDIYQIVNGNIYRYKMPLKNKAESYLRSFQFLEDENNFLAISEQGYFYKYNYPTNKFKTIYYCESKVYAHLYLGNNTFLLGTSKGIAKIILKKDGTVDSYKIIEKNVIASCFSQLDNNHILVGTWFNGMWEFCSEKKAFYHLKWSKNITINDIFKDNVDRYWVSTNSGLLLLQKNIFKKVAFTNKISKFVNALHYNDNMVRFAVNNVIYKVDSTLHGIKQNYNIANAISDFNSIGDTTIIGTSNGDLYRYKGEELLDKYNFDNAPISDIEILNKDKCWVITNEILYRIDLKTGEKKNYKKQFRNEVYDIYSHKGNLYVGGKGDKTYLYQYDKSYDKFINKSIDIKGIRDRKNFEIADMKITGDTIYLGSSEGLVKCNLRTKEGRFDDIFNGLISGVTITKNNSIYVTTSNGVIRKRGKEITTFKPYHGLLSKIYTTRTMLVTPDELLFVGSSNGVSVASVVEEDLKTPKPLIFIANRNKQYLEYNGVVKLVRNDVLILDIASTIDARKDITFEYCLNKIGDEQNLKWKKITDKNEIIISNLRPNEYTLRIRGKQNGNYLWSDISQFEIDVEEVWYLAWYSILMAIFGILMLVYLTLKYVQKREKQKRKELKILVDKRTLQLRKANDDLKQANIAKDKFLSIVGHDLRNPFHIIRSFASLLAENYDTLSEEDKLEVIGNIYNSADNTYSLLENLLEWAKMQKGDLKIDKSEFNIGDLLRENISSHNNLSVVKEVKIVGEIDDCNVFADKKMIDTIIRNLLSNAIKYSKHNNEIVIKLTKEKDYAQIEVRDYGVGMSEEQLERLFKIDKMQSTRGTDDEEGTGFGLLLCKEFVEKHNGRIWVKSVKNEGTSFFFTIPKSKENKDLKGF